MLAAEFPDYDLATLPEIPADWEESSWHNDACPSFMARGDLLHIFVDYADPEFSEFPERAFRFGVYHIDSNADRHELLETNDWPAVVALVETWQPEAA
jgi:hypothetical protein